MQNTRYFQFLKKRLKFQETHHSGGWVEGKWGLGVAVEGWDTACWDWDWVGIRLGMGGCWEGGRVGG